MAISLDVIQAKNIGISKGHTANVLQLPYNDFDKVTAAGVLALTDGTEVVSMRNSSTGAAVWVLVQPASSSATADTTSGILLEAGRSLDFALPMGAVASSYEIDIRAVA